MLQLGKILAAAAAAVYLLSGPSFAGDRPTRTPMPPKDDSRATRTPKNDNGPTRTPIELNDRTRKPTKATAATRTPISTDDRTRKPTKTSIPTRTLKVIEERPQNPTKTARATRTAKVSEEATRTPIEQEERTRKPERPTRTPKIVEQQPRNPTKTPRATRTAASEEARTRKPEKTPRPTRTVKLLEERPQKPTKTARATRTAASEEARTRKPEKTPRATRTAKALEERTEKPDKSPRPTRTTKVLEERTGKPEKTPRATRTPKLKDENSRPATKGPRATRTEAPTKTATPVPQFNVANVVASCSAVLKKNVTVILKITNRSGSEIYNVSAGQLNVTRAPGTSFNLGSAPANFTRLANDGSAVFKWRGQFVSNSGACGFSVSATARGPNGESINLPETDCGTIVLGHGAGESDFLDSTPCGTGAGEGGAAGCGDSGPGPSGGGLPDLTIDAGALGSTVLIETLNFPPGDCALVEQCVGGPGLRRIMRFSTVTPNVGTGDVYLGNPRAGGNFTYSSCHQHYHFNGYANYRLLGAGGGVVAVGHKQAFCLIDLEPMRDGTDGPKYTCDNQGITAGWADVYDRYLDCQWVDITGVPPGTYTLEVSINPGGAIRESNMSNNVGRASVTIPPQ